MPDIERSSDDWRKRFDAGAALEDMLDEYEAEGERLSELQARSWAFRLIEAIDELTLWEPGRKGYAAAFRRLKAERDWAWRELSAAPETLPPPTP
jgi:hypothetical protein